MNTFLSETKLLDFSHAAIQSLIAEKGWAALPAREKILGVYDFVRDGIAFGYNVDDAVSASRVLSDGYGQCNTKGTLFMALLRAVGVPCRLHGFTIDKALQKGAMTGLVYRSAPKEIVHSWVEVLFDGAWRNLEGFILDMKYLSALQQRFSSCEGSFCGYGVATDDFKNPSIEWDGGDTYIQKEGIVQDFGVFDSPDEFFSKHAQAVSGLKKFLFRHYGRHAMNRNVRRLRNIIEVKNTMKNFLKAMFAVPFVIISGFLGAYLLSGWEIMKMILFLLYAIGMGHLIYQALRAIDRKYS